MCPSVATLGQEAAVGRGDVASLACAAHARVQHRVAREAVRHLAFSFGSGYTEGQKAAKEVAERKAKARQQTRQNPLAKTTAKAENMRRRTVNEQLVIKRQLKSEVRQLETPMSSQCSAYRRAGV